MSNLCMGGGGQFVDRAAVAEVITPNGTASWKPVPHIDVVEAVSDVVRAHRWTITEEQFGLAREGQKLFGVMKINKTSCVEWTRCIGLRNSHDKSFAVGLSAGINVLVCSNLAFGGTTVLKRRHTSRIELIDLVDTAVSELENEFLMLETVCEDLKIIYLKNDDEARSRIVRAAELESISRRVFRAYQMEFIECLYGDDQEVYAAAGGSFICCIEQMLRTGWQSP